MRFKSWFTSTPDTDDGLRDPVAQGVLEEKSTFGLEANGELDDALRNVPDLAYWVMSYETRSASVKLSAVRWHIGEEPIDENWDLKTLERFVKDQR
jgi:hypothetical protein